MSKIAVSLDDIETTSVNALVAHGALPWIAAEVGKAIRIAEGKGNLICGLYYLESYCKQLVTGRLKGDVEPEVSTPKPTSIAVDAKLGFAQPAFARALDTAIEVARANGTASLAVRHSHTCTSLGFFTEQIANAGLIGIGCTNASAIVSPPGGKKRLLGTNPIAMAIPAKDGGVAFQFDQSTSAVALGKITMAAAAGDDIPLGWAIDEKGDPTTDPNSALKGALVSSGGYKGFGIGLMVEVLAAALTGSVSSWNIQGLKVPDGPPHNLGQFYFLIDPTTHSGDAFWDQIDDLADAISKDEGARLPGTGHTMPDSVDLDSALWQSVQKLAAA